MLLLFTASASAANTGGVPDPHNMLELECALRSAASAWADRKNLPQPEIAGALARALSTPNCTIAPPATQAKSKQHAATPPTAGLAFYVAPDGSDAAAGTAAAPFATPARAARAIRAARAVAGVRPAALPATVCLRGGTYRFLAGPLVLGPDDSHTTWSGACAGGDGDKDGDPVIFSGAARITPMGWRPVTATDTGPAAGTFVANLSWGGGGRPPFAQLLADGRRQIRARFPNGDPEGVSGLCFVKGQCGTDQAPCTQGQGQFPSAGEGCAGYALANATGATFPGGAGSTQIQISTPLRGVGSSLVGDWWWNNYHATEYAVPAGLRSVFPRRTVESFYGSPFTRASSIAPQPASWSPRAAAWTNVDRAAVSLLQPNLWGNYWFDVDRLEQSHASDGDGDGGGPVLHFSRGGWQDCQGAAAKDGMAFFIENLLEELDAPAEFYFDADAQLLYYMPNGTATAAALDAITWTAPVAETLVRVVGYEGGPYATNIALDGITFTETTRTVLSEYIFPSSGDWAIHPGGTLFVENAEAVNVTRCAFTRTGGNAVYLSRHAARCSVIENTFRFTGDSGVASVGATRLIDGTRPTFPNGNVIARNWFQDIGIFGKQTSCYFQALTANATIADNVCVNVPRAGITFNDGAFGGSLVERNLVANTVRESTDHGPFNSWGRRPILYDRGDGSGPTVAPMRTTITRNFLFADYNSWWGIDHDDGSEFYNATRNFMLWGGCKNYISANKACGPGNVIVNPGAQSRSGAGKRCLIDHADNGVLENQYYIGNKCLAADERDGEAIFYTFEAGCWGATLANVSGLQTWNNTFFSPNAAFAGYPTGCGWNFSTWQAHGQDGGSRVLQTPSVDEIVAMGLAALDD